MILFKDKQLACFLAFFFLFGKIQVRSQVEDSQLSPSTVEHKNFQLDLYLDTIRYNTQEKIGILPYILQNPEGTYLEIGTGGDPIALMLEKISQTARTMLIASDIDENVLKALPVRHPALKKYINTQDGPCLELQKLNAVDMHVFQNESLDGINASSVLHEIISYAGGFDGMKSFFQESLRVLKPGGVLVYRDPECVKDKYMPVVVSLKNKSIRLFTHVFLYKFLDTKCSQLAQSQKKFLLYSQDDIKFTIYKKNEADTLSLTYDEYLNIPSYDIDFSRNYSITLPCGLYRELARHYITYLHDCNPLVFARCAPEIDSNLYTVNYLAHSTASAFNIFLDACNAIMNGDRIDQCMKNKIDQEIDKNTQVLEFGIPLHFASQHKQYQLRSLLLRYGFDPGRHIITLNNTDCLLDYRIFGMAYDEINQLFNENNGFIEQKDIEHVQWLKREGEEFYFYHSADELIAKVLSITLEASRSCGDNEKSYVLCPMSPEDNKFVDRLCYTEILNSSLEVYDDFGYTVPVKDGKRVIHFGKMHVRDAIIICEKIVKEDPLGFQCVQAWLKGVKKEYMQ